MNGNSTTTESASGSDEFGGMKEISRLLSKVDDAHLIWDFFECLFTQAELRDFTKRWVLVKEISEGIPQRDISIKHGLSLCKITRGSRELKKQNSAFVKMLEKLKELEQNN